MACQGRVFARCQLRVRCEVTLGSSAKCRGQSSRVAQLARGQSAHAAVPDGSREGGVRLPVSAARRHDRAPRGAACVGRGARVRNLVQGEARTVRKYLQWVMHAVGSWRYPVAPQLVPAPDGIQAPQVLESPHPTRISLAELIVPGAGKGAGGAGAGKGGGGATAKLRHHRPGSNLSQQWAAYSPFNRRRERDVALQT